MVLEHHIGPLYNITLTTIKVGSSGLDDIEGTILLSKLRSSQYQCTPQEVHQRIISKIIQKK